MSYSRSKKGIHFGLISRGKTVLCDHRITANGDFESTCQLILDNVSKEMKSYKYDQYVFHVHMSGNLTYLCVTSGNFDRNVASNCLLELEHRLISGGLQEMAQTAGPYALRSSFGSIMEDILTKYSSSDDILDHFEKKVQDLHGITNQNIDKAETLGESLNGIVERTELLASSFRPVKPKKHQKRPRLCCCCPLTIA